MHGDLLPVEQTKRLSWSLGVASESMVAFGYRGDLLVRWFWWWPWSVLLRRLPVGDRVDEVTSKQASSTASALVSFACYLTVVSWLAYPFVYIIKIAKDMVSASDVVGYGVVPHLMTSSCDMWWRAMLYFFPRPADCGMQVDGVYDQEKADGMMRSMRLTPEQSVDRQLRVNEAQWMTPWSVSCLCALNREIHCRRVSRDSYSPKTGCS